MPQQRFHNAVDKLMNAFLMNALNHGNPCSCAIGTMCGGESKWLDVLFERDTVAAKIGSVLLNKTKYSVREIIEVERKFEGRPNGSNLMNDKYDYLVTLDRKNDKDGFKGLCNVFDYLVSLEDWSEDEKKVNLVEMCLS